MIDRVRALPRRVREGYLAPKWEATRRPGARLRLGVAAGIVVVLCSLPAVVGALPVSAPGRPVPALLDAVRASGAVPFTGVAESRGTLNFPDVNTLGNDVANLLSDSSRMRIWQASATHFRVDRLTTGGETDVYVNGRRTLKWESGARRLTRQVGVTQLPTPTPPDVVPTGLARRLVAAIPETGAGVRTDGARRIAGRPATALVWHPDDPRSLVGEVRLWVDPTNGLPLRVELRPVGSDLVAFETSFLDLTLAPPDPHALRFDVRGTTGVDVSDITTAPEDNHPFFDLPTSIGGLPQRSGPAPFVATYGSGTALVAVVAFDNATADSLRQQLDSPGRPPKRYSFGLASLVEAPMLRALVFSTGDRGYVLAGTVTSEVLVKMAEDVVAHPPTRTGP